MSKSKVIEVTEISIVDIGDQGQGVGRAPDGKVYMVQNTVPGDIVHIEAKIRRGKVSYARPTSRIKDSEYRVTPFCAHFGSCGGCKWQHMSYEGQLKYKQKNVFDALTRIGGIQDPDIRPISGVDQDRYYRNKLEFSFGARWLEPDELNQDVPLIRQALGFHRPGSFEKIINVDHCYLQNDPSNAIRNFIKDYSTEHNLSYYNVKEHNGLLRNITVRTNVAGDCMVTLIFGEDQPANIESINQAIQEQFPNITLYNIINTKWNDSIFNLTPVFIFGQGYLIEKLGDLKFKIGPKSFFQTNSKQAFRLYQFTEEFANLQGNEIVYDLYSGTGTIGLYLAHKASKVICVEEIKEAVDDAHINAELNKINNATFYTGDVMKMLKEGIFEKEGKPDLIILDPPRAGLHQDSIPFLTDIEVPRIVYISCNPATQARDIKLLSTKYRHIVSQPVDMFPHTAHIENVTLLELIK